MIFFSLQTSSAKYSIKWLRSDEFCCFYTVEQNGFLDNMSFSYIMVYLGKGQIGMKTLLHKETILHWDSTLHIFYKKKVK